MDRLPSSSKCWLNSHANRREAFSEPKRPTAEDAVVLRSAAILLALCLAFSASTATAQTAAGPSLLPQALNGIGGPQQWTSPSGISNTIQVMLLLTVVSLAPAILLMTTSFVRIIVVMGLLRQALGTQQLPPSQVITAISIFMTALLMAPTWNKVYEDSLKPYSEEKIGLDEAWERGTNPLRRFMAEQIRRTENDDDVYLFLKYLPSEIDPETGELPTNYVYFDAKPDERNVPFMLSELKTAFLIGFQIYLPFVVLDIIVASVTISMGMLMLPPVLISLPFKLLLFVLVDGWRLVVEMLMESFQVIA
jgi:flagellar biosynthesis protein FliP